MTTRARELTPRGVGGVSVVEFTGPRACEHIVALGAPADLAIGRPRLARLILAGGLVDEALVLRLAPDRVEVHLHANPALVRAALAGCTPCEDPRTIEARADALLPHAACESAARVLLDQREGALRRELEHLVTLALEPSRDLAAELARRGRVARFLLEPARIVLAGPVNAGKSTLFNVLAGETRALVAAEPGTTRDVLVADILLDAWPARVLDTAGERELADSDGSHAIEAEGQRRARRSRDDADLVLWLVPVGRGGGVVPRGALELSTQSDRAPRAESAAISALRDPVGARRRVGEILRARFELPAQPWTPGAGVVFEAARLVELEASSRDGADPRPLARTWLAEGRTLGA